MWQLKTRTGHLLAIAAQSTDTGNSSYWPFTHLSGIFGTIHRYIVLLCVALFHSSIQSETGTDALWTRSVLPCWDPEAFLEKWVRFARQFICVCSLAMIKQIKIPPAKLCSPPLQIYSDATSAFASVPVSSTSIILSQLNPGFGLDVLNYIECLGLIPCQIIYSFKPFKKRNWLAQCKCSACPQHGWSVTLHTSKYDPEQKCSQMFKAWCIYFTLTKYPISCE